MELVSWQYNKAVMVELDKDHAMFVAGSTAIQLAWSEFYRTVRDLMLSGF
jgi:hypothetical protein